MLNECHSNNRSSTCSNASNSSSQNGIRFARPVVVGHDFVSNILVADLAIRSTAYKPPSPPPNYDDHRYDKDSSNSRVKNNSAVKAKRRVTFNLDNIQIQTIPAYESNISSTSTSSLGIEVEDPIMMMKDKVAPSLVLREEIPSLYQEPPPAPPISQPSTSERISKKASYDALQKRKQYRRDHQQPTIKPGYWYPLATSRTQMMRQPLPSMRTLEMTERLINESIQREIALNPNLTYTPPSPSPSPKSDADEQVATTSNSTNTMTVLITDTDDEEEEEESQSDSMNNDSERVESVSPTNIYTTTTNTTASNTVIFSEEEEVESLTTTTTMPQPLPLPPTNNNEATNIIKQGSDFEQSIYDELAKRYSENNEFQPFPFEQNLIPISANKDVLIISPPPSPPPLKLHDDEDDSEEEAIWIDHPSLLINASRNREHRGLFFVKILNTESLDFPIDNDHTGAYCTIKYKGNTSKSKNQILSHSMQIQHELRIEDINPDEQITISIHVDENNKKIHTTNSHWYHRIRSATTTSTASSDLERYIHEKDGAICQTSFLPSRFITDGLFDQTATLMLVNNWYQGKDSHNTNPTTSLLLKRSTSWKKKRSSIIREKAVGKIYIQCLYVMVPKHCKEVPQTMEEAIEALNAKRFHQTDWQSGYLSQLGGNTKVLKRRYFTLTGGSLVAYSNHEVGRSLLYKIPLTRARQLICDNTIIAESSTSTNDAISTSSLLQQLDSMVISQDEEEEGGPSTSKYDVENGFQIVFDNGESIQFSCETIEERSRWIAVLEVIICKLPKLPEWIIS